MAKEPCWNIRSDWRAQLKMPEAYDESSLQKNAKPIYKFGQGVLDGSDVGVSEHKLVLTGYDREIDLNVANPYSDMTDS